jgi:hypothetical protein
MHTRQFHERLSRLSNNTHSLRSPLDSLDLETVPRLDRRHFAQDVRQVGVGNSTRSPPPTPTPLRPSYPPHPAEPRLTRTAAYTHCPRHPLGCDGASLCHATNTLGPPSCCHSGPRWPALCRPPCVGRHYRPFVTPSRICPTRTVKLTSQLRHLNACSFEGPR